MRVHVSSGSKFRGLEFVLSATFKDGTDDTPGKWIAAINGSSGRDAAHEAAGLPPSWPSTVEPAMRTC
jgi:hypothetical protein